MLARPNSAGYWLMMSKLHYEQKLPSLIPWLPSNYPSLPTHVPSDAHWHERGEGLNHDPDCHRHGWEPAAEHH